MHLGTSTHTLLKSMQRYVARRCSNGKRLLGIMQQTAHTVTEHANVSDEQQCSVCVRALAKRRFLFFDLNPDFLKITSAFSIGREIFTNNDLMSLLFMPFTDTTRSGNLLRNFSEGCKPAVGALKLFVVASAAPPALPSSDIIVEVAVKRNFTVRSVPLNASNTSLTIFAKIDG